VPTPGDLKFTILFDQSLFVLGAIEGVVIEGLTAAALTGLLILLFLGSWRGTLVDDATVTLENIHRHLGMGKGMIAAILDGSGEIAIPAFVSTLCICIV